MEVPRRAGTKIFKIWLVIYCFIGNWKCKSMGPFIFGFGDIGPQPEIPYHPFPWSFTSHQGHKIQDKWSHRFAVWLPLKQLSHARFSFVITHISRGKSPPIIDSIVTLLFRAIPIVLAQSKYVQICTVREEYNDQRYFLLLYCYSRFQMLPKSQVISQRM